MQIKTTAETISSHLTIPGSLEWDSSEVKRFSIATLRYAGGKEHNVRYVSEVHYDAALAREAALREELDKVCGDEWRKDKRHIDALQQRLTIAEENVAKYIYESWSSMPGYVKWVPNGNSLKQCEARRAARDLLTSLEVVSHDQ